jgi:hypothetical protein
MESHCSDLSSATGIKPFRSPYTLLQHSQTTGYGDGVKAQQRCRNPRKRRRQGGGGALRFFKLENPVYSLNYRNRWSHKRMIWALAHARDEAPIRPVAKRFLIQTYLLHFPHFFPRISISEPHRRVTATTRRSRRGPTLGWRKPVTFLVIGRSRWVSSLASTVEIGLNCVDDKCENGASQWRENWRIWRRNRSFGA